MFRGGLSVRSLVTVCLRIARPVSLVQGLVSHTTRHYGCRGHTFARAVGTQMPLPEYVSNEKPTLVETKQVSKTVNKLKINRQKYYWTKKQVSVDSTAHFRSELTAVLTHSSCIILPGCPTERRRREAQDSQVDVADRRRTRGWRHPRSALPTEMAEPECLLTNACRVGRQRGKLVSLSALCCTANEF